MEDCCAFCIGMECKVAHQSSCLQWVCLVAQVTLDLEWKHKVEVYIVNHSYQFSAICVSNKQVRGLKINDIQLFTHTNKLAIWIAQGDLQTLHKFTTVRLCCSLCESLTLFCFRLSWRFIYEGNHSPLLSLSLTSYDRNIKSHMESLNIDRTPHAGMQ